MAPPSASASSTWQQAGRAMLGAWQPLLLYHLGLSLVITAAISPWLLMVSYKSLEFSGAPVLGNAELLSYAMSPAGMVSVVLWSSVLVALVLLEYAGLILVADAALRGVVLSVRQVVATLAVAAPHVVGISILFTIAVIGISIPFLGLAALTYWWLLGGTDISFYLAERPPRFWSAVAIGGALSAGFGVGVISLLARWAFAVPACTLAGCSWRESLRWSSCLLRGRAGRLLVMLAAWQLFKYLALVAAAIILDRANGVLFAALDPKLSLLVWSIVLLLALDAVVMQLLAAFFAVGTATILAHEFENARRLLRFPLTLNDAERPRSSAGGNKSRGMQVALVTFVFLVPLFSVAHAWVSSAGIVARRTVWVTAHRAGPTSAPENSIAALRLAEVAGADYVEIDVQQTSDGHVVLVHDRDLRRVTGDPREVADVDLADLGRLRLMHDGQQTEQHVPTLAEFLEACDENIRLNVEMKDFGRGQSLGQAVVAALHAHGFAKRAVVSCFQLAPLREAQNADPQLPIGIILSAVRGDPARFPVDFLSLNHRLASFDVVRSAHQRGIEVHVWTVNDREIALRMLDLGCDNLITRDPVQMRYLVDWYHGLSDLERMLLRLRRSIRE